LGFRPASLDALNFLLADMRGALGPYRNGFLVTQRHWSQARVGLVTTIAGLLGLVFQAPAGALIDASRAKRGLTVASLALLGLGGAVIFALPRFWPVLLANTAIAAVGDVFGPAVAAMTLGLYPAAALARRLGRDAARRMGRNAAFDHAGNLAVAALAGLVGWAFSQRAVFLLAPAFAVLAAGVTLSIPAGAIDHDRARGGDPALDDGRPSWRVLLARRPLVVFGCAALLIADVMRGTGRYNLAQGAVATMQGIGASLSGVIAGEIVDHAGYGAAFLTAGGIAGAALVLLAVALPETAGRVAG
jgi:MFS family permease